MSDALIALLIPAVMLAVVYAWVPLLNFVCPPCRGLSGRQLLKNFAHRQPAASLFASRSHPADLLPQRREFEDA
jgi:hypothetical protein